VQKPVGRSPREAKDAWYARLTPQPEGTIESQQEVTTPELTPIATAFHRFLEETRATKEETTYRAYRRDLEMG
jgi:hypothetical protein